MPKPRPSFLQGLFAYIEHLPLREKTLATCTQSFNAVASFYGFEKITTLFLEELWIVAPVFKAGLLEEYPPVICKTREGNELLISPSAVLSIIRAYVSHKMNDMPHPLKFSFEGPSIFWSSRHKASRTAKNDGGDSARKITGRSEWGLLMVGEEGPVAEAEIIQVIWKGFIELGMKGEDLDLVLGAVGCSDCHSAFHLSFNSYFRSRAPRLCKNCKRYLKRTPTRILVCEEEKCRVAANGAPQALDFLCENCKKHLGGLLEFLDEARIPYFLNPRFFREGSWFDTFIFEFREKLASQSLEGSQGETARRILAEGGRISRLGTLVAGRHIDAASGTVVLDAVEEMSLRKGLFPEKEKEAKVFLAHLGELAKRRSLNLLELLRVSGIQIRESLGRDSVKSQLKIAEHLGARIALILGQKEALDNTIIVREVDSGIQETIPQDKLVEFLKRKLKK